MNRSFRLHPQAAACGLPESHPNYPHVRLTERWRLIECRDAIQWILQVRNRAEMVARDVWRARSYCRTRDSLICCCEAHFGPLKPELAGLLEALPDQFPGAGVDIHMSTTGTRFGHLTVLYRKNRGRDVACRCTCQRLVHVAAADLHGGTISSCGCKPPTAAFWTQQRQLRALRAREIQFSIAKAK